MLLDICPKEIKNLILEFKSDINNFKVIINYDKEDIICNVEKIIKYENNNYCIYLLRLPSGSLYLTTIDKVNFLKL